VAAPFEDYRWLVSEAARPWLAIAHEEASSGTSVALLSRLRKNLSAEQAHLVVEQVGLRQRAREKFSLADQMFFTRKGLEQATDEQLATYKAARFPAGDSIADLCCGIGGDLISLAKRGPTRGVDLDPIMALLAKVNAVIHGLNNDKCSVETTNVVHFSLGNRGWHCDPDRRATGRRATRGELFDPSLEALTRLIGENRKAAIKLAPATEAPADWKNRAELEWLGNRGECRQQVVWFEGLARYPGNRSATVLGKKGDVRTIVGEKSELPPAASQLRRFVYEPHAAVLAAKLTAVLCRDHELKPVAAGIAYLTGDRLIHDPTLDAFEIVDELPLDRRKLKAYCRERHLGRLEIKKRGVEVDPERLRKEFAVAGDGEVTIIITPIRGQVRAIVAQRIGGER
jgi:hypothetical protein